MSNAISNAVTTMNASIVELVDQSTAQAAANQQSMLSGAAIVNISAEAFAAQAAAAVKV
jgi:hypothetical protein